MNTNRLHFHRTVGAATFAIAIGFLLGFVYAIHWALNVSPWQAVHDLWYSLVDGARFK
jgi:ABC-type amino acid transport system permease subunit